ncbi:MAG TPA: DUF4175 family protein, partial [Gemmatimonadaceae bacterium]|nr:DUF4175 family protein [Gemmatimonadaceae bacterium]
SVALWIEERFPSLEYRLVTTIETGDDRLLGDHDGDRWPMVARRRATRVLASPAMAAMSAIVVLLVLPGGAVARMRSPHAGDALERAGLGVRSNGSRLSPLVADVSPPAYSGLRSTTIDEPSDVRTLAGSMLTLRGRGDGAGIVAIAGTDTIAAAARGGQWSIPVRVGTRAMSVRLRDRSFERMIAVEPIVDRPPVVTLMMPVHDSVLRSPTGRIPLSADVTDDYGISVSSFEYIISSGEGETFTFRSGTLGTIRPQSRRATMTAQLSIDELHLEAGDIVHVRAVARDANDVTGPGIGVSETRAIRVARADEYDSVAVDAAAPSAEEKGVISERMLIVLAEALQRKQPSMTHGVLAGESHSIAVDQKRLRRTVGEIVFTRLGGGPSGEEHTDEDSPARAKTMEELLARADSATTTATDPIDFEGGESPVVAVNKPLLEAYNAMWDASSELEIAEPGRALPHMRAALAAIQRARLAERIYLRGAPPKVVIDVNSVRLKGKDKGATSERRPLASSDSITQMRIERFARAVDLVATSSGAAVDSLLVLRIDAITDAPPFAAALGDAVAALRKGLGDDATRALTRARRALAGSPVASDSLSRWSFVP